jgi:transposase
MRSIGVDLHKSMFMVCWLSEGEKEFKSYELKELAKFKSELRSNDRVAVEATGNTRYFVQQIRESVSEVVVVNPRQFRVISDSVKKTDREDAEMLALFLEKEMLPVITMKDEQSSQVKSMANTRDRLVKLRTVLKNKIHNILNAHGIQSRREDFSSEKGLEKVLRLAVNEAARIELEVIVEQIRYLNEGIKKLDQEIKKRGGQLKGFENITSIKGIGDKSGAILLSIIGNIDNYESEKKLHAYFGIVPRVSQSGEKAHYGRITKEGSKLGRTTLVQCTLIAIRYSPYLEKFYSRLKAKKGSGKAIIATSRKLLTIIYQTLKNEWVFEDFPNFVLKQP